MPRPSSTVSTSNTPGQESRRASSISRSRTVSWAPWVSTWCSIRVRRVAASRKSWTYHRRNPLVSDRIAQGLEYFALAHRELGAVGFHMVLHQGAAGGGVTEIVDVPLKESVGFALFDLANG